MTQAQQRRTRFDTRSVMLFAAISLSGAGALHAQGQTSSSSSSSAPAFGPTEKSAPAAESSKFVIGGSASPQSASMAFDRADTNKDGQLSAQEAAKLPAIGQRFKELDTDKSGMLSREEFEKGANS
ncbi:EF-hand domain-containing protein [Paracidovorax sp. MALMAid1276]|uniref:EF-hand domain-containing protein n=1 Tax=Paracidovorax sp. MALMAid1276 TaxID=3411631 RepID=UPI003B99BEA6